MFIILLHGFASSVPLPQCYSHKNVKLASLLISVRSIIWFLVSVNILWLNFFLKEFFVLNFYSLLSSQSHSFKYFPSVVFLTHVSYFLCVFLFLVFLQHFIYMFIPIYCTILFFLWSMLYCGLFFLSSSSSLVTWRLLLRKSSSTGFILCLMVLVMGPISQPYSTILWTIFRIPSSLGSCSIIFHIVPVLLSFPF